MFILDPQSGVPIYRQLLEQVRRMVASGQLSPGTELPSVRELAVRHAVNPMTIADQARAQSPLTKRLQQLEPQLEQLILAAHQLQLSEADLLKALRKKWGAKS